MTSPGPRPQGKSPTAPTIGTRPAEPAGTPGGRGAPKVAARQGVLSAVRPDSRVVDRREPIAWLHVVAPPDWRAISRAASHCACGRHVEAVGREQVRALIEAHAEHRDRCPLRVPAPERSQAA